MKTEDRNDVTTANLAVWLEMSLDNIKQILSELGQEAAVEENLSSLGCSSAISYFNNQIDTYLLVISFGWMIVSTFCSSSEI